MKRNHPFKAKFTIMLAIIFTLTLITFSQRASSISNVPDIKVTVSQSSIKAGVNEEFTINYHFEPQPIPMDLISPQTDKEIVLVIDTSGSMKDPIGKSDSTVRMTALRTAANNFIDKFYEIDNVKIGIVTYSTQSKIETTKYSKNGMVSSKEKDNLKAIIKGMTPDGGTNIGDGLRTGMSLFSTNPSTKKYLVFMSDGEPTALTYSGYGGYYYYDRWGYIRYQVVENTNFTGRKAKEYMWGTDNTENDQWDYYYNIYENSNNIKYGVYGGASEPADKGFAIKYSKIMAKNVKDMGIKNFVIGFSDGASEKKLMDITNAANGLYFGARDANAINEVYSQIADQIKADFATEDVKINFNLPEGIEYAGSMKNIDINGTSYAQRIPDIKYKLNKPAKQYEAAPFDITITLKATKSGVYDLSKEGWNISYQGINSNIIKQIFPSVIIDISKYDMTFNMSRSIVGNNTNKVNLYKDFQMEYKINPNPIKPSNNFVSKPKEVVLVLDTSKSMDDSFNSEKKISILKEAAKSVIDRFNGNTNVKVALVSYNSGALVKDFGKSLYLIGSNYKDRINSEIDKLTLGEGSNTGDAIRKALWVLANNNDAEKHIVVIGDGKTDYYTHEKDQLDNLYTELNNEVAGTKVQYDSSSVPDENNKLLSEEYVKTMAGVLVNQNYRINSYFITLGEKGDDSLFRELASKTNGIYFDHRRTSKSDFQNSMLDIADEVRAQFVIKNPKLIENLPEGLTTSEGSSKAETVLPNLVYIYNSITKQYEAKGITATLDIKGNKIGTYDLVKDATINYVDIEKINRTVNFDSLRLSVIDEYILKQGLFTNKPTDFGTLGENYLINNNQGAEIAEDFVAKVGTYVRTSGQPTAVKIVINKEKNTGIKSINMDSIRLFKVTEKNELEEIKGFNFTNDKVLDNYREITVNLPAGDTSKYNHYIINYNFSTTNKGAEGGNINCSATIEEVNRSNDFILKSVMLPDVF